MKTNPHDTAMDDLDIRREHRFSGASRIILLSTLLFAVPVSGHISASWMKSQPAAGK